MLTTWIDQTTGERWTGVALLASIDSEVVLEQLQGEVERYRIMREYPGQGDFSSSEAPRTLVAELLPKTHFIGAMFKIVALVQRERDEQRRGYIAPVDVRTAGEPR